MAEPPTNDQQLLRQLSRGDEAAFAAIYDRHQGPIFRFALHMTGSSAIAEEVTQEVFMLLMLKANAYKPERGSLAAYLFGVARNLARDAVRRGRTSVPLSDAEENDPVSTDDWDVLEKLSQSEALDLLRKSLLGLPELYREVVVLCDLEENGYAEAAAMLECSQGTVASRLHRAHAMLRSKLSRAMGNKPCLT